MKIKYIFGPRTGEVEHVARETAAPLIAAKIAESLEPNLPVQGGVPAWRKDLPQAGDAKIPQPKWSVENYASQTGSVLAVVLRQGSAEILYTGHPKFINARREWANGNGGKAGRWLNGFGREVPKEICKEYAKLYDPEAGNLVLSPDVRAAFSSHENELTAADKSAMDAAVASGRVPYHRVGSTED